MVGERIMWALCLWAAGFVSAVIVGARNGEQMAAGVADVLDTCDEMARADRVDCLARVEIYEYQQAVGCRDLSAAVRSLVTGGLALEGGDGCDVQ